jgi:phage minor structural protein
MRPWYLLDYAMDCIALFDPSLPQGFTYKEDLLTEKLSCDGALLEFELNTSHPMTKNVNEASFILLPQTRNPLIFSVLETEEDGKGAKHVWCEPLFVSELGGHILRPVELKSARVKEAINHILSGSGWVLDKNEGRGIRDISFSEPLSALEALHTISQSFNLEIQFQIKMQGFKVIKRMVDLVKQRGRVHERPVEVYEEEMELKKRVDRKELVTALVGIGPQKEDGSYVTFQEYTPPIRAGIEKKEDWVADLSAKEKWGNGRHIFGVYRDEKAQNPVELYRNTVRELKRRANPRISYTLQASSFKNMGEEVSIGDTLFIRPGRERKTLRMRVNEKITSSTNPEKNSFTLEKIE